MSSVVQQIAGAYTRFSDTGYTEIVSITMALYLNKDTAYRSAKPKDKDYKISDGGGLSLLVKTNGVKRWVFVYRFEGKQNMLGFGVYQDPSL